MLRVKLVNVPFADWNRPSFALSQLTSLVRREFGDRVTVDVCYLNQDFAEHLGVSTYDSVSGRHDHVDTGFGDWLFRQIAFPDSADNTAAYFDRYYRGRRWAAFRERMTLYRQGLPDLCAEFIDRHALADADIVGFSSMFAQHVPSLALARMVKNRNRRVVTAIGGANCEAPMGAVIAEHVPDVDFVFSGPALDTFPAFVRCVLEGDLDAAHVIPGIVSSRNCRQPRYRRAIGADHDIDDVIRPDYDSFLQALDAHPGLTRDGGAAPMLFFETSRGCWWGERSHCTFCGLNGQSMGYRAMSADLAVDQFRWLFGFAPRCTSLFCTDNILPRNYARDVFPRLDPPPGVSIFYEVKLPLRREDLKGMAAAGVTVVQPGIEALATSTLKLMGKGTTAFQNIQFLKNCVEFGIDPEWNLLIGFPGEDESVYARYEREIPRLTHLKPPHGVYMVRFDRYSPYFDRRHEFGLDLHPMDYYGLTYPFEPAVLDELAYFFADHSLSPYMLDAVKWHDRLSELVADWRAAWYAEGSAARELRLVGSVAADWQIRDTRSGAPVHHDVDEPMVRLLKRLASPTRPDDVAEAGDSADDLGTRLAWLDKHQMLFEEDGRSLSLVLLDSER